MLFCPNITDNPLHSIASTDKIVHAGSGTKLSWPMHKLSAQQAMSVTCLLGLQGNGIVPDLPALGTALPIIITTPAPVEGKSRGPLVLPTVGSWVKLRNVRSWVIAGQLQVCHHCLVVLSAACFW